MDLPIPRLTRAFMLTDELVAALPEEALKLRLGDLPSNTIGEQLWCIIGARESYLKAMRNEGWAGFSCSLTNTASKEMVVSCLDDSSARCLVFLDRERLSPVQNELFFELLEHEVRHHGQLIRYIYGNKLTFPKSWKDRYTL